MARVKQNPRRQRQGGKRVFPRAKITGKNAAEEKVKQKKHRFRPGTRALIEIRRFQRSTELLLQKLPFERVLRHIACDAKDDIRFKKAAVAALQTAAEDYLIHLLEDSNLCAIHSHRVTVFPSDLKLVLDIRKED